MNDISMLPEYFRASDANPNTPREAKPHDAIGRKDVFDTLPQTIFELDNNGNITFSNQTGFTRFGYTPEDLKSGSKAIQMVVPSDREKVLKNIQRVMNGEKTQGIEYTALRKDSSTFPVIIFSVPIIEKKKTVGLRGIIIDITEYKRTEADLIKSNELYRMVVENAGDLIIIIKDGYIKYVN